MLLNVSGEGSGFLSVPGEEYIPPEYGQLVLPSFMLNVRSYLFGSNPDRMMLNYRSRQLLTLLHSTELLEFVLDLDPRITYDLDADYLFTGVFGPIVTPLEIVEFPAVPASVSESVSTPAPHEKTFYLQEQLGSPDELGRSYHQWRVSILTASTVEVERQTLPVQTFVQDYTVTAGLSSIIDLPGSELRGRFDEGVGNEWLISGFAKPARDLGTILANLNTSTARQNMNSMFGVGTPKAATEPFKTFRNLWNDHNELAYRLGGLLLALIYNTEEIRTSG